MVAILIFLRFRDHEVVFDWTAFAATFSRLDWPWLALATVLAYSTYVGRALRSADFLRPLRPQPELRNLVRATIICFTAHMRLGRPVDLQMVGSRAVDSGWKGRHDMHRLLRVSQAL